MSKRRNDWLPLIDACRIAGIGYREAWQAVADGRLPATRKGRRWLVKPNELVSAIQDEDPTPAGP